MDRKSNAIRVLPAWESLAIMVGGGIILALTDIITRSVIVIGLAGITGTLTAASVFKYGRFDHREEFPVATLSALLMCTVGSIWAGVCRCVLGSWFCTIWNQDFCKECPIYFAEVLVVIGGSISLLMAMLFCLTLGKESLTHSR